MNVVREINAINQKELELGLTASWHDDYKDSARIFVGGLSKDLSEGDVITILSQYGEIMDIHMPRDKETGAPRGFAFAMYEDQRSTILAVDNLNGAKVLERTLRVDHVRHYHQPRHKNDEGEWVEPDEESMNAKPEIIEDEAAASDSSEDEYADIDPEDPMRDYLIAQRKEEKANKKDKKKYKSSKHKDETAEERAARKARKREKKEKKTGSSKKNKAKGAQGAPSSGKSDTMRAVEDMLKKLGDPDMARAVEGSSGRRRRSETPERGHRDRAYRRHSRSRSRSPGAPSRQSENRDRDYHRRRLPTRTRPLDDRDDRKRFSDDEEGRSRRRPSSRDRLGR